MEFKNLLSMQPAVITAVINLLVLACISGDMQVWKRDELVTQNFSFVTGDKSKEGDVEDKMEQRNLIKSDAKQRKVSHMVTKYDRIHNLNNMAVL